MHLVLQVIFDYKIKSPALNNYGKYTTKNELYQAIKATINPYELIITRDVQVVDTDNKTKKDGIYVFGTEKQKNTKIASESIKFVIADKLLYPNDIRKILTQKYGNVLDFDNQKWNEDIPVLYSGVTKEERVGLKKPRTSGSTHCTLRHVNCRPLTLNDIVINKNLNQIWPKETNVYPEALRAFLARKKERIYQR